MFHKNYENTFIPLHRTWNLSVFLTDSGIDWLYSFSWRNYFRYLRIRHSIAAFLIAIPLYLIFTAISWLRFHLKVGLILLGIAAVITIVILVLNGKGGGGSDSVAAASSHFLGLRKMISWLIKKNFLNEIFKESIYILVICFCRISLCYNFSSFTLGI